MEIKKICYVGELDRTKNAPDHLGIRDGLTHWEGLVADPVLYGIDHAIRLVQDFQPDLLIHGNTDTLGYAYQFRNHCKKQVFWMLDYQPTIEQYAWWDVWKRDKGQFDALFISNKDQIDDWKEAFDCPTYYLPHGCVVQKLVKDEEEHYPLVFIGQMTESDWFANRYRLIKDIEKLTPITYINEHGVSERDAIWKRIPAIYHTSDCVLDISHTWKAEGYASGRFFYSGGLGGCSITKRFPGCEELYPKDCKAYFDTPEEAVELIKFYQSHEKEREAMKVRAWKYNKKFHNYKLRFEQMINKLT